jgi:hypothetical protein
MVWTYCIRTSQSASVLSSVQDMLVGRLEEFGGLWNCNRQLVKCEGVVGTTWATGFPARQLAGERNTGKHIPAPPSEVLVENPLHILSLSLLMKLNAPE